jgi:dephospho-CoA kinase
VRPPYAPCDPCARLSNQEKRSIAEFVVDNSGSVEETERQVKVPTPQLLASPDRIGE